MSAGGRSLPCALMGDSTKRARSARLHRVSPLGAQQADQAAEGGEAAPATHAPAPAPAPAPADMALGDALGDADEELQRALQMSMAVRLLPDCLMCLSPSCAYCCAPTRSPAWAALSGCHTAALLPAMNGSGSSASSVHWLTTWPGSINSAWQTCCADYPLLALGLPSPSALFKYTWACQRARRC
jgi:hypothetical protein